LREIGAGDTLVVVRLDRLARTVSHLLEVIEDLTARNAHFRSLRDPIDTTTPQGMFSLQVLSRDSSRGQWIEVSLLVQGSHGCVDGMIEGVGVLEGLMGEMKGFEVVPDHLDVVELNLEVQRREVADAFPSGHD
jgi:hypothetical protein